MELDAVPTFAAFGEMMASPLWRIRDHLAAVVPALKQPRSSNRAEHGGGAECELVCRVQARRSRAVLHSPLVSTRGSTAAR
jgi:hypothetical protein